MPLNKSTGNMYEFISHTWNTIKGECPHGCSYCYMHRWGKQKPIRFDERELKTDLGSGNFIFVGSSCDMFAGSIPVEWIRTTISHCQKFNNKYLFQTKNPQKLLGFTMDKSIICTTIESDLFYPEIMQNSPKPYQRANYMEILSKCGIETYVTVEPIMDFNINYLLSMLRQCCPIQVNIGADTGRNNLPEPPKEKIIELISELEKFTKVVQKPNLKRLIQ